jgi:hypothetical protein
MSDYRVTLGGKKRYNIGVNYEVPSKSIQYTNLILDDFSLLFDGVKQSFLLTVDDQPYTPYNSQQLLIYINGEILEAEKDYTVSGSQIYFFTAPNTEDNFYGIALITTADLTRTINYEIDSGSFDMEPGIKGQITLDVSGTIESWTVISENPGNLILDIKKSSYLNYPNMVSIVGTENPHLGVLNQYEESKNKDDDLTTWDRILNAGDVLQYEVLTASNIRRFLIALKLRL